MMLLGTKFLMNDYIKPPTASALHSMSTAAAKINTDLAVGTLCPTLAFTRPSLKEINKNLIVKYFGTATVSF